MSRFFRSADSTSSSNSKTTSESESDDKHQAEDATEGIDLAPSSLVVQSTSPTDDHRDFLLHALLEERCLNEARSSLPDQDASSLEVRAEGQRRYQRLCDRLASYDLISTGLHENRHASTRQRYRDGLDILSQRSDLSTGAPTLRRLLTEGDSSTVLFASPSTPARDSDRFAVPGPLRGLLTGPEQIEHPFASKVTSSGETLDLLDQPARRTPLLESRYRNEFEELGTLGRGGYGVVYHVRHRLDNQVYAIKKVPLSPRTLSRVQQRGQLELEEVLREIRTLARLDHPNVVRYYGGWIEWNDGISTHDPLASTSRVSGSEGSDAVTGADSIVQRTRTESSTDDADVFFENSGPTEETIESIQRSIEPSYSFHSAASSVDFREPCLALHMQMTLHPMTLADFLAPLPASDEATVALSHCFHLGPSVSILLAILDGLEYLHGQGIYHRDIKPANIFMGQQSNPRTASGCVDLLLCDKCRSAGTAKPVRLEVRIGDFGLVSVADQGPEGKIVRTNSGADNDEQGVESGVEHIALAALAQPQPEPTRVVGTELYHPATVRTGPDLDLYPLGIVAFELLCKFDTRMERLHTIQELKDGRLPSNFCPGLQPGRANAVKKCILTMLDDGGAGRSLEEFRGSLVALQTSTGGLRQL